MQPNEMLEDEGFRGSHNRAKGENLGKWKISSSTFKYKNVY